MQLGKAGVGLGWGSSVGERVHATWKSGVLSLPVHLHATLGMLLSKSNLDSFLNYKMGKIHHRIVCGFIYFLQFAKTKV
jgi:hypothetical protein